jgi:hypothetical protein
MDEQDWHNAGAGWQGKDGQTFLASAILLMWLVFSGCCLARDEIFQLFILVLSQRCRVTKKFQ